MTQNRDVRATPEKFESSSPHHHSSAASRYNGTRGAKRVESGHAGPGYSGDTRTAAFHAQRARLRQDQAEVRERNLARRAGLQIPESSALRPTQLNKYGLPDWPRMDVGERLRAQVSQVGGCLEWTGALGTDGYGRIQIARRKWSVHRLAWMLHRGHIPDGLCVMHTCDNPRCVSINHLRLGTHLENMMDRDAKGRGRFPVRIGGRYIGEHRPAAGLTPERGVAKNRRRRIRLGS